MISRASNKANILIYKVLECDSFIEFKKHRKVFIVCVLWENKHTEIILKLNLIFLPSISN